MTQAATPKERDGVRIEELLKLGATKTDGRLQKLSATRLLD